MKVLLTTLGLIFVLSGASSARADYIHGGRCTDEELDLGYRTHRKCHGHPRAGRECHDWCESETQEFVGDTSESSAIVVHPRTGETLGTIEEILREARRNDRQPSQCSGKNCEWIGFCYCSGHHGG